MPETTAAAETTERHLDSLVEPSPLFEATFKQDDVIRALSSMTRLYDNPDSPTEELAIEAARKGRPAYWTTEKYHNQVARLVCEHANRESLRYALERFADDYSPIVARHTMQLLADLIPLNGLAIRELAEYRASAQLNLIMRVRRTFDAAAQERARREGIGAVSRAIGRMS